MGDGCFRRKWTGVFVAAAFSFSARLGKGGRDSRMRQSRYLTLPYARIYATSERYQQANRIESTRSIQPQGSPAHLQGKLDNVQVNIHGLAPKRPATTEMPRFEISVHA